MFVRAVSCCTLLFTFCLPSLDAAECVIDTFDDGVQNSLQGYRNTFQRAPSSIRAYRTAEVRKGDTGRSLCLTADRKATGFCGYWIHLFNFRSSEPVYFDAASYRYLSFWVKGEQGGAPFTIKLADQRWVAKEDSLSVGSVTAFLPQGVTDAWQQVVIPLEKVRGLDLTRLGSFVVEFTRPGHTTVYLDDITFLTDFPGDAPAVTKKQPSMKPSLPSASPPRAMWIWETVELLGASAERSDLWKLCHQERIRTLWIQLPYTYRANIARGAGRCEIRHAELLRRFLIEAHQRGIQVHALDGAPEYCLRRHHHIPLAVVDAVLNFNAAGTPRERFDGIHFDNEPHLLVGWESPERRENILQEYLRLNLLCQKRVNAESKMNFGVDIPFWWQARDPETGLFPGMVTFGEKRKPASFHCLDALDEVGIMDYRDTAHGADGIIVHGEALVQYATANPRAKVWIGVETFQSDPVDVWFLMGLPRRTFYYLLERSGSEVADASRFQGLRLHRFDDGELVHVGLEAPAVRSRQQQAKLESAMRELAQIFSISTQPDLTKNVFRYHQTIRNELHAAPQWGAPRVKNLVVSPGRELPGFVTRYEMLSKITFADNSLEDFRLQLKLTEEAFQNYPGFAGIAIHYYKPLKEKLAKQRVAENRRK